ncbi:polysaccharide lyase family 8 super-sandwich domain-containing protein [Paenibacillus taiwanensis]|uniref:polysaccharide lyase family 8 super-sandwich domain-containing protein n=1 Tax=Paenibacillus taiwanensis TaxID=401638 RepID=UPI0004237123|nr:polysaccharide lyase family 8 super-sandwich domain-containing protein [Paenibacillus taiwanensis]
MKKILSLLLVVTIVVTLLPVGPNMALASTANNLIPNGNFELAVAPSGTWTQYTDTNPAPAQWDTWIPVGSGKPAGRTVSVSLDTYTPYNGQQSLLIDAVKSSRVSINTKAPVVAGKSYRLRVWYKTENVAGGSGVYFRTSVQNASNTKLMDGPSSTKVYGTNDWTMQQVFITVPTGGAKFFVELFFENSTGKAWFDNILLEEYDGITGLALEPAARMMTVGETKPLTLTVTPNNMPSPQVVWSSSDEQIAAVDQMGHVTAVAAGVATITVATADQLIKAQSNIGVDSVETAAAYSQLRSRWKQKLVGAADASLAADPTIQALVAEMDNSISNAMKNGYLDTLSANNASRSYLWSDLTDSADTKEKHANNIVTEFTRIKTMATAYHTGSSRFYQDPQLRDAIIGALDWMYAKRYNERLSYSSASSWWGFEIGAPQLLNDCLILMYDELTDQLIANFMRTIDKYCPNPTKRVQNSSVIETGGNLLDKALVVTVRGVIGKNSAKITQGRDSIGSEFNYVTSGDGVYEDGSLVQHANIAYTAGYGAVWLSRTADITYLLNQSPWPVTDPRVANVYKWVSDTFEPVIYKGLYMDMVNGRGISRKDSGTARGTIVALASLAEGAPSVVNDNIRSMVKEWVSKDTTWDDYYKGLPISSVVLLKKVMNDTSVAPRGELSRSYMFNGMARVAHHRPNYTFGLSLFSDRISAFEMGNKENVKGWDTGLGMTYIYNEDLQQYRDGFWATVNSFRLPGTTTDGSGEGKMPGEWAYYYNSKNHVGGATLDHLYSASGMDFSLTKVTGSDLSGKKSWFMFDDEIVALGADIRKTSAATKQVETIVDNRKLNSSGNNALVLNGVQVPTALDYEADVNNVQWAHLAGNRAGSGADMGYYFPNAPTLHVVREARTGAWYDINNGQSKDQLTRNYASLSFEHGTHPQAANYEYVLLPGKTSAQTEAYSEQPAIEVLSNTSTVQAARNKQLGITAANFWSAGSVGRMSAKSAAAVIMKEQNGEMTIALSDPTQKQNSVTIEVLQPNMTLLTASAGINVTPIQDGVSIEVNTTGSLGQTYTATFDLGKTYTVTVDGAKADKQAAKKGEIVTVALDTPGGKVFDKWNVTPTSLTLTPDTTNTSKYSFVMPGEAVKVLAVYKEANSTGGGTTTAPGSTESGSTGSTGSGATESGSTTATTHPEPTKPSQPTEPVKPADPEPTKQAWSDISEHWAKAAIQKSAELGFVTGYEDGTFRPNGIITRGELAAMLARALKLERVNAAFSFADQAQTPAWAQPFIQALAKAGYISGYEDGTFRANKQMTRSELVVLIVRARGLEVHPKVTLTFGDADQIPAWAKPYVAAAVEAGLIQGNGDGKFKPNAATTRAEAITLILRLLNVSK